jgi:hypothetical protein
MLPEPLMKASPPVKGCPLFAVAALGMLATVAGFVTLGGYAIWSVIS